MYLTDLELAQMCFIKKGVIVMLGKKTKIITALVLAAILVMAPGTVLQAEEAQDAPVKGIYELEEGKKYSYDLDGDGVKENLSYELKGNHYRIYINGETVQNIKMNEDSYGPKLQIADLDKDVPGLDLWAYCYASSDDILYSGLYRYKNQDLQEVFRLNYEKVSKNFYVRAGYLSKTDGNGNFSIAMDRVFDADTLVGNYYVNIPYQLRNGKVYRVAANNYTFATLHSRDSKLKAGKFKAAKKIKFYAKPSTKSKVAFILKKGKVVRAEKIYFKKGVTYVKFRTGSGKAGYLKGGNSYNNIPFTNVLLAD